MKLTTKGMTRAENSFNKLNGYYLNPKKRHSKKYFEMNYVINYLECKFENLRSNRARSIGTLTSKLRKGGKYVTTKRCFKQF